MKHSVLILTGQFDPDVGGIGTFAAQMAEALEAAGVEVTVLTSTVATEGSDAHRSFRVRRGPKLLNRKFAKMLSMLWLTATELRRVGRDTTIVAMAWPHEGLVAYAASLLLGVPYAVVVHGSEITRHARTAITARMMKSILGRAKMVLANSRFTLQIAATHFSRHVRGCVLNPCIGIAARHGQVRDATVLDARWDLGGRRVLFTASRLTKRKGHAEVIRALGVLRAEFPTLCYVFTGSGNYVTELRQLAREVGCDDLLRPVGRVDLDTLHRLYQRCDLYVSPGAADDYDYEGFGIAFMEAAYHGKVVVAGRDGGVGDAVLDGKTGLLVNPTAIPELADAIRRLLLNPSLRETMGELARRRAIEDFSIPAMTKRLHEIGLSAAPSHAVERSAT